MPGRREVGAHGDAERAVVALLDAQRHGGSRGVAVCGEYDVGAEVASLPRLASGLVQERCADTGHAAVVRPQGFGDAVPLEDLCAGGLGVAGQFLVKAQTGADQTVLREVGDLGPGQFDGAAAGDQAEAFVAPPTVCFRVRQAELLDLADSAGSEPVAADLFAREARLLQDGHVQPGPGKVVRGGGSGGTGADNQYLHRSADDVAAQLGDRAAVGGNGGSAAVGRCAR